MDTPNSSHNIYKYISVIKVHYRSKCTVQNIFDDITNNQIYLDTYKNDRVITKD